MRMMSMSSVREFQPPSLDNSEKLKIDSIEKSSFKSDYNQKVESLEKPNVKEVSNKDQKSKTSNDVENKNIEKKGDKLEPQSDKVISENPIKNKKVAAEVLVEKNTKNIKTVSRKVSNKNDSEDEIKKSDKDILNQSMAGILNGQIDNTKLDTKSDSNGDESKNNIEGLTENKIISVKENGDVKTDSTKNTTPQNQETQINQNNLNIKNKLNDNSKDNKKSNNKDDKKITVTDLRKESKTQILENGEVDKKSAVKADNIREFKNNEANSEGSKTDNTIVLGSTEISAEGEGGKSQAPVLKEASQLLKQQLKSFGNDEIVKQSRFVLKDNGVGEIRLILKPDSLGEVKINLNLKQNSLAGQIVVENNSVKEIFQENLSSLTKALEEQGYDSAKLELSLSDKGESDKKDRNENKQYFSERLKRIDESGSVVRYGAATAGIDLTA